MTTNEKNLEGVKPQKSGDHQIAGTPITKTEDNAQQQRQEKLTAAKAFRFTSGDAAPFTIDMGNGEKVQDKRPLRQENSAGEQGKLDPAKIPMADVKDDQGRILQKNYADGRHTDIHYDKNGQPDEIKTPDGQDYKRHTGKDGKPDGTWDVTVPKDKSPDGKEHHYNTHIDVKVAGDGAVSWTTKAGEHSKIDTDGKWHKDVVKEDSDALHTDLSKRDMGDSTKKLCEQVNKDGNAEEVYQKLLKEHPEDKGKVHLVTKFDENGKMTKELAPGPDPIDGMEKQVRTMSEARDLATDLGARDMGASAQKKLDDINKNGDGKAVYDQLSDADKKMVHLEDRNGVQTLVLGADKTHSEQDPMDDVLKQARMLIEANDLNTALLTRDMGATAQKTLDEMNKNDDGKKVYDLLSADDKKMVHLELENGKEVLKLGEAPPAFIDSKEGTADKAITATGDRVSDASDPKAEAAKIKDMIDKNGNSWQDPAIAAEMKRFARTHASQFEAMCNELARLENHFILGALPMIHIEKDKNGKIKVTGGIPGIALATLYDGTPGSTGND